MPKLGETRYVCWVTPRDVVRQRAIQLGWDPNSDESPNDYADTAECERSRVFSSLGQAVEFAQKFVSEEKDWWGSAWIYHEVCVVDPLTELRGWRREHKWDVSHTGIDNDETVDDDEVTVSY